MRGLLISLVFFIALFSLITTNGLAAYEKAVDDLMIRPTPPSIQTVNVSTLTPYNTEPIHTIFKRASRHSGSNRMTKSHRRSNRKSQRKAQKEYYSLLEVLEFVLENRKPTNTKYFRPLPRGI